MRLLSCLVFGLGCAASASCAAIEVTFRDGNPWDVFTVTHSGCAIISAELTIDLSTSVAGVLIDTAYGGPGTQDPMPAELSEGSATLSQVSDGDQELQIAISKLDADTPIQVRLDLDDTAGSRYAPKIEVYGDEITGATVTLDYAGTVSTGTFTADGYARIPLHPDAPACDLIS